MIGFGSRSCWLLVLGLGCARTPPPEPEQPKPTIAAMTEEEPAPEPAEPTVSAGESIFNTTDKDIIRRTIRTHLDELRECYEKGPTGRIAIEFTIGPSGAVERVTATDLDGDSDPAIPACIEATIETWVFPEPRDGGWITISYPYN